MRRGLAFGVAALLAAAVGAAETETLFEGADAKAWSTARDEQRLAQEFSLSEMTGATNPDSLLWRFVTRGVAFNDIFLHRPVARRFDTIRVRLRNEGAAFTLACKTRDANGAEWTAQRVPLPAGGEWRWVEFPVADWAPASWSRDADGTLNFPLAFFALIAFDIKPGAEYRLRVAAVEAVYPDPPEAGMSDVRIPKELRAGESYSLRVTFSSDGASLAQGAAVVFLCGGGERMRVPLALPSVLAGLADRPKPGARVEVEAPLRVDVPQYAFGGSYAVALRLGDTRARVNGHPPEEGFATVTVRPRETKRCVAEVKPYHGTPTLFIKGEPHSGMTWATYGPKPEVFADFTKAGITLYTFAATPTESGYGLSRTAWTAPDTYDFSQLDERALMLLKENPNAYFFPRLYLHAPKWWSEAHPDVVGTRQAWILGVKLRMWLAISYNRRKSWRT